MTPAPNNDPSSAKPPKRRRAFAPPETDGSLETTEALVAAVRAGPARFPDLPSLAVQAGVSPERLADLLRRHYHATPDDVLRRARLAEARRRLLADDEAPATIAREVGYASAARLEDDFLLFNGLAPAAYRALRTDRQFTLRLPEDYPLAYLRRALGRDGQSVTERLEGDVYTTSLRLGDEIHLLKLTLAPGHVFVSLDRPSAQMDRVHAQVTGLLGLDQDAAAFTRLAQQRGLSRLVDGRAGLRVSQTLTVFSGLLWTVTGQQINLPFACLLQRRLIEKTGAPAGEGLHATPTPQAIAALAPDELLALQFSRQKAGYLITLSQRIVDGKLDLDALPALSATRVERSLLALRGLGPWSVNYLMMRSLGFADCLPLGDTGVTSGLQSLFQLEKRPDAVDTLRLMAPFSPFRSLATAHLWQFNRPAPP